MKVCNSCHERKSLTEFYKVRKNLDGLEYRCKECCKARDKVRRSTPGYNEHATAVHREWLKRHPTAEAGYLRKKRVERPGAYLIKLCRQRAKKYQEPFTLKESDLVIPERCPLLGIPLKLNFQKQGVDSPSVDRIDPSRGYEPDNVWVISHRANTIKNDATLAELELIAANLRARLITAREDPSKSEGSLGAPSALVPAVSPSAASRAPGQPPKAAK
jgi:hypothetical protein